MTTLSYQSCFNNDKYYEKYITYFRYKSICIINIFCTNIILHKIKLSSCKMQILMAMHSMRIPIAIHAEEILAENSRTRIVSERNHPPSRWFMIELLSTRRNKSTEIHFCERFRLFVAVAWWSLFLETLRETNFARIESKYFYFKKWLL